VRTPEAASAVPAAPAVAATSDTAAGISPAAASFSSSSASVAHGHAGASAGSSLSASSARETDAGASGEEAEPGAAEASGDAKSRSKAERRARRAARDAERKLTDAHKHAVSGKPAEPQTQKRVVWVVDDTAVARRAVARVLRAWGFKAVELSNGQKMVDALEALVSAGATSADWPSAVILDSSMPVLDGMGALRALREMTRAQSERDVVSRLVGIKIVGATGAPESDELSGLMGSGASVVLSKPIDPESLHAELVHLRPTASA
jgi:CheY-like chemotaxis protein